MFMLGFVLLGTTLLLPLFMQTLLGYTAQQAGLALMPGGFMIMLLHAAGWLSAVPLRAALSDAFWLVVLSFSLFHMTGLRSRYRFQNRGAGAHDAGRGPGISFRADQHGGVFLSAAGQKQRRVRADQSGAKHWGQRGHFGRDHHARPPDPKAPERSDEPSDAANSQFQARSTGSPSRSWPGAPAPRRPSRRHMP